MTSGWIMLGLATLVCLGLFANGARFARLREPIAATGASEDEARRRIVRRLYGRLAMVTAPVLWLLFASICFGLFGPVANIQPIELG